MSALQQAFSKWLESCSEEDRAKAPEIVKGLQVSRESSRRDSREKGQGDSSDSAKGAGVRGKGGKGATGSSPSSRSRGDSDQPGVDASMLNSTLGSEAWAENSSGHVRAVRQDVPVVRRPRNHASPAIDESLLYVRSEIRHPTLPKLEAIPFVSPKQCQLVPGAILQMGARNTEPKRESVAGAGGIRRKATIPRVQVGLDFGTSSTKVLFRRLDSGGAVRPIDFAHDLSGYPSFAVPSVAVFDRTGQLLLGDTAVSLLGDAWDHGITGFKMLAAGRHAERYRDAILDDRFTMHVRRVLNDPAACTPELLCAVFIAYVMRRARRWLEAELGRTDIDILFNTCVPVDQRQDDAVFAAFCRIAAVAESLERSGTDHDTASVWLLKARKLWPDVSYDESDSGTRLFVVPEAIAATAGYLSSAAKAPGLHALVDIGAGTADVSIFNVSSSRKGGLTTLLLGARSIPLGAAVLEERVTAALGEDGSLLSREGLLEALAGRGAHAAKCRRVVEETLRQIWNGTSQAWGAAYRKNPGQSKWSGNAVQVFISGGGALIPEAQSVFAESWQRNWGPYPTRPVPGPDVGVAGVALPFARLCVAFGLTVPRGDLGSFLMPDDVPTTNPPQAFKIDYSQDGDQLIPRYGWT